MSQLRGGGALPIARGATRNSCGSRGGLACAGARARTAAGRRTLANTGATCRAPATTCGGSRHGARATSARTSWHSLHG
eukprot:2643579-Alexandrium_andersonii.AAC.1